MYYESTKNCNFIRLVVVISYEGRLAVPRLHVREGQSFMDETKNEKNEKQNGVEFKDI